MGSSRIGKILTVCILVGSASFMGFAIVTNFAGPNWKLKSDELSEYNFVPPAGPGSTWDVTARDLQQTSVAKTKSLVTAYVSTLKHKTQTLQTIKSENDQAIGKLKTLLADAQSLHKVDSSAIQKRIDYLKQEIQDQNSENKLLADQILSGTDAAQKLNEEIALRREDTERMHSQLEELRSRYSVLNEQKRRLSDLLIRAKGDLERVGRRYELLKSETKTISEQN